MDEGIGLCILNSLGLSWRSYHVNFRVRDWCRESKKVESEEIMVI